MATPKDIKVTEKASDMAKNIWLAGLGAYGKAFDEAQERYEKVSKDTTRMFDELVAKGKKLEGTTSTKLSEARTITTSSLEERISKVRHTLGFGQPSIEDLALQISELNDKLDLIIETIGAKPKAKTAKAAKKEEDA
jgi:Poly(hydroxyalcanoate) granule associated protein (phasin)